MGGFEPVLDDVYKKVKVTDLDDTEVVYMSVDADEDAFKQKVDGMPWVAVPYNTAQGNGQAPIGFVRKKHREELGKPMGTLQAKYELGGVPSTVVLDGRTGEMITKEFTRNLVITQKM